jgi:iron complex transport system substrate-binding protein
MKYRLVALLSILATVLSAQTTAAQIANFAQGCAKNYDPAVDYFPDKVGVEYAKGFSVEYFHNYKVMTLLTPWQNAEQTFEYVLVQRGTPAPEGYDEKQIIEVPVNSFVSMSTTFLPHLDQQGVLDRLVGRDSYLYTNNANVIEKIEAGDIAEVGGGGGGDMNVELLIDLDPDLVMMQQFSAESSGPREVLEQAGLKVVLNADFVDTSPLGVAEWGKYIALFFNTEAKAQDQFDGVVTRYRDLADFAAKAEKKPTVFASSPFNETWFMPGGQSYVAQLLGDAGADYLWADDDSPGSLFLDFESVYDRAADAEFWVNVNSFWPDATAALAEDERYGNFAAFKNNRVYAYNKRVNANGGSDYFESGYANPDVILADLIKMFHPELLPDHELVYYQKLPPGND